MFTGIVEATGTIRRLERRGGGARLTVDLGAVAEGTGIGDSIAVDGVCLTVTRLTGSTACFDVVRETLERTNLGDRRAGDRVNLERALAAGDRFDGHFVQGHVDGTATVHELRPESGQVRAVFRCPERLTDQMIEKGSVAVDGVSLTIAGLERDRFTVALIPHTLEVTTLSSRKRGDRVNIECDLLGKWVRRILSGCLPAGGSGPLGGGRHGLEAAAGGW